MRDWEARIVQALRANPELQTWAHHLEIRLPEIRLVSGLAGIRPEERVLEIGCGNGLASAYFARQAGELVASDLGSVDHAAHSIGLENAKKLLKTLELGNVRLSACSAEDLPFEDESFDVIVSLFTLEHLPHLAKGLGECRRVLKPGGRFVAAVPAAAWSFYYPLDYYWGLARKVAARLGPGAQNPASPAPSAPPRQERVVRDWASFRKTYRNFPLPEPHGEYATYFHELWSQRPSSWESRCRSAGFRDVRSESMGVIPRGFLMSLLGKPGLRLFQRLESVDAALRRSRLGRPLAQSVCLLATK